VSAVREEVVDVTLAEVLGEYGLEGVSLLHLDGWPDVYLPLAGRRVLLEAKEAGQDRELEKQLDERLRGNLCDVAVGVIYPREVVVQRSGDLLPPTPQEVRNRLRETKLKLIVRTHARTIGPRDSKLAELPELLRRLTELAVPEEVIGEAVQRIQRGVEAFTSELGGMEGIRRVVKDIESVLASVG
jgi:hypothetical protein